MWSYLSVEYLAIFMRDASSNFLIDSMSVNLYSEFGCNWFEQHWQTYFLTYHQKALLHVDILSEVINGFIRIPIDHCKYTIATSAIKLSLLYL